MKIFALTSASFFLKTLMKGTLKSILKGITMSKELKSVPMNLILVPENPSRMLINRVSLEELAESLKSRGLLQPILLRAENEFYRIEAGHRRFLAASMLGWENIDAIILESTSEDALHLERAHENLIRADLNPVEESKIVWDLVYEDGRGVEKTARLLCKTQSWIDSRLEIAKFPIDLKDALVRVDIKVAVAKELNKVSDPEMRARLLKSAVDYGASAQTVHNWINDSQGCQFLDPAAVAEASGDVSVIDRTQVTLPCRICNTSQLIDVLRHIWICPDCLGAVRELSREVQRQMGATEPEGIL